jgi:hypothetical protein
MFLRLSSCVDGFQWCAGKKRSVLFYKLIALTLDWRQISELSITCVILTHTSRAVWQRAGDRIDCVTLSHDTRRQQPMAANCHLDRSSSAIH